MTFVTDAQVRKLNPILANWRNGNLKDAHVAVRKLTRRELFLLMCANHQLPDGFICDPGTSYDFESFVDRALAAPYPRA